MIDVSDDGHVSNVILFVHDFSNLIHGEVDHLMFYILILIFNKSLD